MGWYVIQVRSGHEKEIVEKCECLISKDILQECFIPEFVCQKRYKGKWNDEKTILFRGYVFMITEKPHLLSVELNKVPDFTKMIGVKKTEVFPLEEDEVAFLKSFGRKEHIVEMSIGYIQGDVVHVTEGPLKGKEGLITKIDRHKRIAYLQTSMFNKETVTKVGLEIISKY